MTCTVGGYVNLDMLRTAVVETWEDPYDQQGAFWAEHDRRIEEGRVERVSKGVRPYIGVVPIDVL